MTYDREPARDRSDDPPTGVASDLRVVIVSALLTFGSGALMLIGFLMAGFVGFLLACAGIWFGGKSWAEQHGGQLFPRNLPNSSLTLAAAVTAGLTLIMFLMV